MSRHGRASRQTFSNATTSTLIGSNAYRINVNFVRTNKFDRNVIAKTHLQRRHHRARRGPEQPEAVATHEEDGEMFITSGNCHAVKRLYFGMKNIW